MKKLTIAIDGYSGCGKSTIAKDLAKALNYVFIDSGAMYRGVTLFAMENNWIRESKPDTQALIDNLNKIALHFQINPEQPGKQHLYLNGRDVEQEIRSMQVANSVSKIATISEVRKKLVDMQRAMGENGGIVMDGRDIGSVVFPNADLKFFITARPEIRAKRRQAELEQKGENHSVEEIKLNLLERDQMDTSRADSPLMQTDDSILIDTSDLTRETQLELALNHVKKKV